MDVANALNMQQYQHINIKCNRQSEEEPVQDACQLLLNAADSDDDTTVSSGPAVYPPLTDSNWSPANDSVVAMVLLVNDVFGSIGLTVALILTLGFVILFCCGCVGSLRKRDPQQPDAVDD